MNEGQGFARRVTMENLATFAALLKQPRVPATDEGDGQDEDEANEISPDPAAEEAEAEFAGISLRVSLPFAARRRRATAPTTTSAAAASPPAATPAAPAAAATPAAPAAAAATPPAAIPAAPATAPVVRGPIVWRKVLRASDVQRQTGNPTGGVRLTQAGFTVGGSVIDQTTYFRNGLFGGFQWTVGRPTPLREDAVISFSVELLGQNFGIRPLTVSHKPTGEAGQGNYTTILHWGDQLGPQLRTNLNLVGRTLTLYGPAAGTTQPFFIVVA